MVEWSATLTLGLCQGCPWSRHNRERWQAGTHLRL